MPESSQKIMIDHEPKRPNVDQERVPGYCWYFPRSRIDRCVSSDSQIISIPFNNVAKDSEIPKLKGETFDRRTDLRRH